MNTSNIKTLGGLGSLFIVLSVVPYIGFLFSLIGIILLGIALKNVSDYYPDKNIFKNYITGLIISIVSVFIAVFGGLFSMLPFMSGSSDMQSFGFGVGMIVAMVIGYFFLIASSYFYKQAFYETGMIFNSDLLKLGGNFIFWGSIGAIIFIGLIAVWIGWILISIGFFTLPEEK